LGVVLPFERGELSRQIGVGGEQGTQSHEGAHDFDIDPHSTLASQYGGKHRDALLGEGARRILEVPTATAAALPALSMIQL